MLQCVQQVPSTIQLLLHVPAINLLPWAVVVEGTASCPCTLRACRQLWFFQRVRRLQVKAENELEALREIAWVGTGWVCCHRGWKERLPCPALPLTQLCWVSCHSETEQAGRER